MRRSTRHENHDRYRRLVSADQRRGTHLGSDRRVARPLRPRSEDADAARFSKRRLSHISGNPPVAAAAKSGAGRHHQRSLRRRCTSRPRARSDSRRGAIACATACASPPRITPSFRSMCARDFPFRFELRIGRCAGSTARRSAAWSARSRCARTLPSQGFRNLAAWRRGVDTEVFKPRPKEFLKLRARSPPTSAGSPSRRISTRSCEMPWGGSKIVIGDGPQRARLQAEFPRGRVHGVSIRRGSRPHLAAADVMVFPSRTDTFGLVNLEAMACGVPVAAYPVTGPIDVIEDGVTGALDVDLGLAAAQALSLDPGACRRQALRSGWDVSTREFEGNLVPCHAAAPTAAPTAASTRCRLTCGSIGRTCGSMPHVRSSISRS